MPSRGAALLANLLHLTVKASVFVTFISFGLYILARLAGPLLRDGRSGLFRSAAAIGGKRSKSATD